jgi:hypothetical protein
MRLHGGAGDVLDVQAREAVPAAPVGGDPEGRRRLHLRDLQGEQGVADRLQRARLGELQDRDGANNVCMDRMASAAATSVSKGVAASTQRRPLIGISRLRTAPASRPTAAARSRNSSKARSSRPEFVVNSSGHCHKD